MMAPTTVNWTTTCLTLEKDFSMSLRLEPMLVTTEPMRRAIRGLPMPLMTAHNVPTLCKEEGDKCIASYEDGQQG